MSVEYPKFKELKIPTNWCVHRTSFYDVSPDAKSKFKTHPEDDGWTIFNNELLIIDYLNDLFVDMGWTPQFSPEGKFDASLIKAKNWEIIEEIYLGRSLEDVTDAINRKLLQISLNNGDYHHYLGNIELQPLRPFHNWRFVKNEFFDVEPNNQLNDTQWQLFAENMLYLEMQFNSKIRIEMGWSPAFDPDGSYKAKLINENLKNPLLEEFATKEKDVIAEYINQAMEHTVDKLSKKREQSERERERQLKLQQQKNQKV